MVFNYMYMNCFTFCVCVRVFVELLCKTAKRHGGVLLSTNRQNVWVFVCMCLFKQLDFTYIKCIYF